MNFIHCNIKPKKDLSGQQFGRWTVLYPVGKTKSGNIVWECLCSCGMQKAVVGSTLINGTSQSCGCRQKDDPAAYKTHGKYGSSEYKTWSSMLTRCNNMKNKNYKGYGDRGISVCPEWFDFAVFYKDMGDKPPGFQLDRKNNNQGYSKENCHWVSPSDNANNRNSCHMIEIHGKKQSLTKWAREFNMKPKTVANRITKLDWSAERALTTPIRQYE